MLSNIYSKWPIIIYFIIISGCLASDSFEFLERKPFEGDFNSFYLGQKACISATFGYDWIESILLKIVAQSVAKYNQKATTKEAYRYAILRKYKPTFTFNDPRYLSVEVTLKAVHPLYRQKDKELKTELALYKLSDSKIDIQNNGGDMLFADFQAFKVANGTDYTMFFELPYALRVTYGLIMGLDRLDKTNLKVIKIDPEKKNLVVMVNCNNQSQQEIMSKAVPADQFELSGM